MSKKPRTLKGRLRGTPPPATFSLDALPNDTVLTQAEVAAIRRQSLVYIERKRNAGTDGLTWRYIDGRPRCTAGSLKKVMAGDPATRLRSPKPTDDPKSNSPDG